MPASFDWLWYLAAALLAALGLWLFYWSLFHDRARGRRRCPKCWYDMSASPSLLCSECGYVARRERRLFKTRRRWTPAVIAILLVAVSAASALTPRAQRHGFESIIPTTLLMFISSPTAPAPAALPQAIAVPPGFALPGANAPASLQLQPNAPATMRERLASELRRRLNQRQLWSWQWRWLMFKEGVTPDASHSTTAAIAAVTHPAATNVYLIIDVLTPANLPDLFVCPVIIRLLRDGEEVARWDESWFAETGARTSYFLIPFELRGNRRPFGTRDYAQFTWAVEIRGDPCHALLESNAKSCWTGRFSIPLMLEDTPSTLQFVQIATPAQP